MLNKYNGRGIVVYIHLNLNIQNSKTVVKPTYKIPIYDKNLNNSTACFTSFKSKLTGSSAV